MPGTQSECQEGKPRPQNEAHLSSSGVSPLLEQRGKLNDRTLMFWDDASVVNVSRHRDTIALDEKILQSDSASSSRESTSEFSFWMTWWIKKLASR
jgi:hypothetical protein